MKQNKGAIQWHSALIIGNGPDMPASHPLVAEDTLIICADGGYNWAKKWGLVPHLLIGDFDSLQMAAWNTSFIDGIPTLRFPVEKDETDLELSVKHVLGLGITQITLVGAWGGSIGHSLGNLEVLYRLGMYGIDVCLITSNAKVYLVNGELELQLPINTTVSLIALSEQASQVTTKGLYYALDNADIAKGNTLTISNKTIAPSILIKCGEGILIAVVE